MKRFRRSMVVSCKVVIAVVAAAVFILRRRKLQSGGGGGGARNTDNRSKFIATYYGTPTDEPVFHNPFIAYIILAFSLRLQGWCSR